MQKRLHVNRTEYWQILLTTMDYMRYTYLYK